MFLTRNFKNGWFKKKQRQRVFRNKIRSLQNKTTKKLAVRVETLERKR